MSPKAHAASTALCFALFGLLSFEPVGKLAHSVLSMLPCASWEPIKFHPLGALNWAAHAILLAIMTTMSHVFIGSNEPIERVFHNMFKGLLRTFIFGTGLSVKLGPWVLLPVFVGVNHGAELPTTFKYLYIALIMIPAMIGNGFVQSDATHLLGAVVIAAISGGMALSLNRKVLMDGDVRVKTSFLTTLVFLTTEFPCSRHAAGALERDGNDSPLRRILNQIAWLSVPLKMLRLVDLAEIWLLLLATEIFI
ncbi:hypothetical protein THAOC_05832 [Thalassiosira oceanica]|uniref:Uncharacterized protein n=1 Tax=Thalassiosira oceanica TaxID=159749 RepID=K0T4N2_THAOC|nr:hypothetical protein THAOC_05832 [Thalassiosira oceanica]|eukprot:EJK72620.1 hypothetical protein THAOC_05832 [Thalassiosira oceanica]